MTNIRGRPIIFANRSGEEFAEKVLEHLNSILEENDAEKVSIAPIFTKDFADGQSNVKIRKTVRGRDVYLIQNFFDPEQIKDCGRSINDNFMETVETIAAIKISGANKITLVVPYYTPSRQDKSSGRESVTARVVADILSATGVDNILFTDLHADQIMGFFDHSRTNPVNLRASNVLLPYIRSLYTEEELKDLVIVSPDAGGTRRAQHYANKLGTFNLAFGHKVRSYEKANVVESLQIVGDVEGKKILIVDDMIDTGGTIEKLIDVAKKKGVKDIKFVCTHPLLNASAIERLEKSGIDVIGTDTIPWSDEFLDKHKFLKLVSVAPLFAMTIYNLNHDQSLRDAYNEYSEDI